jgi:hypothetical protein
VVAVDVSVAVVAGSAVGGGAAVVAGVVSSSSGQPASASAERNTNEVFVIAYTLVS